MNISLVEQHLLNDYQRDFPLMPTPFTEIAKQLKSDPGTILSTLRTLHERGMVSRIGPVFRPHSIGASTLAAMAVPTEEIENTAAIISGFEAVNHNYEREHVYNLWFVVTAADQAHLRSELSSIEKMTGYSLISLPLVVGHHIDLGFQMNLDNAKRKRIEHQNKTARPERETQIEENTILDEQLIETIQFGLPLVERPYQAVGEKIGHSEKVIIERIDALQVSGAIKRFGVVVRHHELGYRANAMLVWDVSQDRVDELGEQLSKLECVTLCYQRQRHLPEWPYNLFCMIHGRDRDEVKRCIEEINERFVLRSLPHQVLFSTRCFKQRGARYRGKDGCATNIKH